MIAEQLINILNDKLKNPIYKTVQLINIKDILKKSNFTKKEGVAIHLVVLHFVYMLVMNKKIATFIKHSDNSFKKDVYYRLLKNQTYNWRRVLSLSSVKLILLLQKQLQNPKSIKVFIIDDTVEDKTGKKIEGSRDKLYSNKEKRFVRGINIVSLNYSDGLSNFMLDFAINMGNYARVAIEEMLDELDHRTIAYKRRAEIMKGKHQLAIDMVKRAVKSGVYADYLLVDSWYSKPIFLKEMNALGIRVISRMANNKSIWNFKDKANTLDAIYEKFRHLRKTKSSQYGKIKFTYFSVLMEHKKAGKIKIVFIKTSNKLIPIVSTDIEISDGEIIETYKRRWDIEQGYKELRQHFGFGKEENRIYEALIARITLSFFTYNIVSYINRISNEPQTIGGLFKDLECELSTLAIAMQTFITILEEIAKIDDIVNIAILNQTRA